MLQYNLEVYGLTYQYILHLNDYKILLYKAMFGVLPHRGKKFELFI